MRAAPAHAAAPAPPAELTPDEFQLFRQKALEAKELSYSPYSNFRVGCAVLTASGTIVQGANVENASYGASVCAERATICTAVLRGDRQFRAIGISSDMEDIITPCGICRQFIREFGADIPVFMFKRDGHYVKMTLNELLPLSFGPDKLL